MSSFTPAAHGGQLRLLAAEFGCRPEEILDFSANINPDGPPASVLLALQQALDEPAVLTCYPDLESHDARRALADHCGLAMEHTVIGNGFVPLLEAALRANKVTSCLLPVPAFSEYRRTLERCGVTVLPVALTQDDFRHPVDDLIHTVRSSGARAVLLANPQNPSGALTEAAELTSLVHALPDVLILLDEAFIDYTPAESLLPLCGLCANLIVFRSVTKFYAMPGLRIAYCVASPQQAGGLSTWLAPWPVSTLAGRALIAAIADSAYAQRAIAVNTARRQALRDELTRLGMGAMPSATNFLLLRLPLDAAYVRKQLLRTHHVHVRTCVNFEALTGNYVRVAVRGDEENMGLVNAMRDVLASA